MQLLEQLWRNADSGLSAYSLALLNHMGYNVVDSAKNMLEWMSDTVTKQFEEQRSYPFHFKHLHLCHSLHELEKLPLPYVLLTSQADLSSGFARNLLAVSAEAAENCIIVTQRTKPDTLASRLLNNSPTNNTIDITIGKRVPLEGKELEDHLARYIRRQIRICGRRRLDGVATPSRQRPDGIRLDGVQKNLRKSRKNRLRRSIDGIRRCQVMTTVHTPRGCTVVRNLLAVSAEAAENCIIVTQRTKPDTLASRLLNNSPTNNTIDITIGKRVPLEGKELEDHLARAAKRKQEEEKMEVDDEGEDTDEEGEDEEALVQRHDVPIPEEVQYKKKQSFFKQHKVYPMFPYHEDKLKWDEYGEIIKHEHFNVDDEIYRDENQDAEKAAVVPEMPEEIPTKCVTSRIKTQVNCRVKFIDFEGRSDGESIKRILSAVLKPRQMIIIHGTPDSSRHLAEFCSKSKDMGVSHIFVPGVGETVNATSERHIYQVKLKDALVTAAKFSRAKDAELAWIDAVIGMQITEEKEQKAITRSSKAISVHPSDKILRSVLVRISEISID
eukprot:sb/3463581/